jgi:actin-related protein 3
LTGLVVDSGEGSTSVIPVSDGYVISSAIQEIPIGGAKVTEFVSDMLKDRGEDIPAECRMEAARTIKESHTYLCRDVIAEYQKYDVEPQKRIKTLSGIYAKRRQEWNIHIGYERFLAPEIFFHPEMFSDSVTRPLPSLVDNAILQCPIDTRRKLYQNIVLSGGSTTFTHFKERLEADMQAVVDARQKAIAQKNDVVPTKLDVKVHKAQQKNSQRYAAWIGGSLMASNPSFASVLKTKADYQEQGPACMRGVTLLHS